MSKIRSILQMSSVAIHNMLSLPKNYTVVGATCNLLDPRTISLLIEISGEEIPTSQIPVPVYQREEINGKHYVCLDHMDWFPQPHYPMRDLMVLPRWLLDPLDTRLPRTIKPFYLALLYRSMEIGSEKLVLSAADMQRLAQTMQPEIRRYLNNLREQNLVRSWSSEGTPPRVRQWNVELVPGGALLPGDYAIHTSQQSQP